MKTLLIFLLAIGASGQQTKPSRHHQAACWNGRRLVFLHRPAHYTGNDPLCGKHHRKLAPKPQEVKK